MAADLSPSITRLSAQIAEDANVIESYLASHSLPPLSLAENALPFFPGSGPTAADPFPAAPKEVQSARDNLRERCEMLLHLVTTPSEVLMVTLVDAHLRASACMQYVYHFKIADAVPLNGSISYKDLADRAGVDETQCARILRTLMTEWCFIESTPGYVSHTSISKCMTVPNVRDCIGYLLEEGFVGASRIAETAERFKGSEERNHAPWNVGHKIDLPIYEYFETDPVRLRRFLGTMECLGGSSAFNVRHIVNGYDWKSLGAGTVVDVGGNNGHISIAISHVASQLNFVVQDLEQVVNSMNERTKGDPHSCVRWEYHDFFQPQPIKNATVYLLRFILHNYSDKYAARILKAIVPALGEKSKILILDGIIPESNTVPKPVERKHR